MAATLELSARNQLPGTITKLTLGAVMAEVAIAVGGGQTIVAAISRASAEAMGLKEGDRVVDVITATEVMVGKG